MRTADEINADIEINHIYIEEKRAEIENFEIDQDSKEDQFNDMLDDCHEGVFNIKPSRIMQKCDPILHRQELSNYVDSLEISEEEDYKTLEEELETLNDELEDLEEELEEANEAEL